jgi:hypothetical protein
MTITLPHELTEPLSWIGLTWPEADEDKLYADGQAWIDYGSQLRRDAEDASAIARTVWTDNYGESIEAFERWWEGEGPGRHLGQAATAVELIGAGLVAMAGVTIALKTAFIAQLVALAFEVGQAVATAFVTAGATLAEVPGWIALTRTACRVLIHKAIEMVEREIAKLFAQAGRLLEKAGAKTLARGAENIASRVGRGSAFHGLMAEVERADVVSPLDGANFYSGKDAAGVRMRVHAEGNTDGVTKITLEQTPGGSDFDKRDLFGTGSPIGQDQADKIWRRLSQRYAQTAKGDVTAYAHDPASTSVWLDKELPALQKNKDVTSINIIDP